MSRVSLDRIADDTGRFAILAMDQRGTLRTMLDQAGQPAGDADLSAFKVDAIAALSPVASAVLTDVEYGVAAVREARALAPNAGLLIASERSPQRERNGEVVNEYDPARGPEFVAGNGGAALKFLVRWRPDRLAGRRNLAGDAVEAVRAAIGACRAYGLPSVVEPLVAPHSGDPAVAKRLVIRSAEVIAGLRPDLLKLEWPGDAEGCRRLTEVCGTVPWALLSSGVTYEQFVDRVLVAMDAGASGYIAGRAFWGEAVALAGVERRRFLQTTGMERMTVLNAAIRGRGRSWHEVAAG